MPLGCLRQAHPTFFKVITYDIEWLTPIDESGRSTAQPRPDLTPGPVEGKYGRTGLDLCCAQGFAGRTIGVE